MAIYGRTGDVVTIVRRAVLADVRRLEKRNPDKQDREALKNGSYVIVKSFGEERLYHMAFLRATAGYGEIEDAIKAAETGDATKPPETR